MIFNANPLLRYDGYYILADVTEIPNLRQKATTILSRKMGEWCLGLEQPDDPFLPERNQIFFALYSVAAAIYRWVVVFSILLFLYKIFEPYGLEIIGQIDRPGVAVGTGGHAAVPGGKVLLRAREARQSEKTAHVSPAWPSWRPSCWRCSFVPLPHSVMATLEVQPRDAARSTSTSPAAAGSSRSTSSRASR